MKKQGKPVIISAPSGTGKTTLVHSLVETLHDLDLSISHTTRPQRPGEKNGVDYHFVDESTFKDLVSRDQFLEYARVFDHYYGTSKQWVKDHMAKGRDIILEIDWQGAQQVRRLFPNAVSIFILPPSYETLHERLQQRGDDKATVSRRMHDATRELSHYAEYNFLVINDNLETARNQLAGIIRALDHGYAQQQAWFDEFVHGLLQNAPEIK